MFRAGLNMKLNYSLVPGHRDIDERHLLRLGAGERELREGTMKDFSKFGRVNYTLRRRLELLSEVQRLAESIGVEGVSDCCWCIWR